MGKKSSAGKFALGAAVGAALGAVGGLLFAPKSGKETRADIAKKAGEAKDFTVKKAGEVREFAGEKFDDAKDFVVEKSGEVKKSAGKFFAKKDAKTAGKADAAAKSDRKSDEA